MLLTSVVMLSCSKLYALPASAIHFFYEPGLPAIYGIHGYQKVSYPWGDQIIPPSFDGNLNDIEQGNFLHLYKRTSRREAKSVHWLSFKIISKDFFKTNGHLAIVGDADNSTRINTGKGLIIGRNYRSDNDVMCKDLGLGTAWAQPEIWWSLPLVENNAQGTWVGGGSQCGAQSLSDYEEYTVFIHFSATGYYYSIKDKNHNTVAENYVNDEFSHNFYDGLKSFGMTFGIVFGHAKFPWDLKLFDIKNGEFQLE